MAMHRFFADKSQIADGRIELFGDDVKHISKVLRLRQGEQISVCNKEKTDYLCTIASIEKERVILDITEEMPNRNESNIEVTLYQGLPKGDKMDMIIQKSVELGAVKIVPVEMKRSVAHFSNKQSKLQRWQRIADEASKQCMRGILPEVAEPITFDEMLDSIKEGELTLLPYENEINTKLKTLLRDNTGAERVNIIIGPEGGFDEEEIALASERGIPTVTLGPRIMRCETAPLAAISAVMYELGDW